MYTIQSLAEKENDLFTFWNELAEKEKVWFCWNTVIPQITWKVISSYLWLYRYVFTYGHLFVCFISQKRSDRFDFGEIRLHIWVVVVHNIIFIKIGQVVFEKVKFKVITDWNIVWWRVYCNFVDSTELKRLNRYDLCFLKNKSVLYRLRFPPIRIVWRRVM